MGDVVGFPAWKRPTESEYHIHVADDAGYCWCGFNMLPPTVDWRALRDIGRQAFGLKYPEDEQDRGGSMKVGDAFTGQYLKADTFVGKRTIVTCDHVESEKVGDDTKPVLYFVGKELGLVLNKTNANMIAEIAGDDEMDNWKGVRIVLYGTKTDFQGKRVNAIRVDYPQSKPAPPPVPVTESELDDDPIPF